MDKLNMLLKNAEYEMKKLNHPYVGSEHLLLAILHSEDSIVKVLNKYNLYYDSFQKELIGLVGKCKKETIYVLHTPLFKRIVDNAKEIASSKKEEITMKHLVISLLEESDGIAIRVMANMNVDLDALYNELIKSHTTDTVIGKEIISDNILIGRDKEMNLIISSLLKKDKCNPLLIGPAGVGKTALVEELARRLKKEDVPDKLIGYKIISVEMGSLVAGTKYRGEFEEKLNNLIESIKGSKTILFIDEIHTLVNAGGADGAINASDILKPYLARGDIKIIGATTTGEYNNTILNDKALNRRFDLIPINETDVETTKDILTKIKCKYEVFHDIEISDENIDDIVKYSNKYIHNKYNPDKCIEILDLVCAKINSNCTSIKEIHNARDRKKTFVMENDFENAIKEFNYEFPTTTKQVTKEDILCVISNIISSDLVTKKDMLVDNIKEKLGKALNNQFDVIHRISANVKYKLYHDDELLSLILEGTNGVGKSTTISILSKELNRNKLVINLDEFGYEESIDKLTGSVYHKKYLFQEIRNNPCSIIQINNYDHACYKVKKLFQSILENGYCYDYTNEKLIFSNSILIFTTNKNTSIGFNNQASTNLELEVDDVISYMPVTEEDVKSYVDNYNVVHNENVDVNFVLSHANYEINGYKDVQKAIQKFLRTHLLEAH